MQIENPKPKTEPRLPVLNPRNLFAAILFIALIVIATRNVTDPDFGWHLRTGEYIVTTFSIPRVDFFSFTATGHPWVTHEWLTQVGMYLLYQAGGFAALSLFFALAAALTFALVYLRCAGKPYLAAFVILLAALAAAPFWGARPQTLSLLLTSAFLFILDRHRYDGNGRRLVWLAPLMLVWVNSHASFALGLALIGIYFASSLIEKIWRWHDPSPTTKQIVQLGAILAICAVLIALNPNGIRLYFYPFETLVSSSIQNLIQEWQPPDFSSSPVQPFFFFLILTCGALIAARQHLRVADAILLIGFAVFGLRAARQISIWVLIAAPILAQSIEQILRAQGLRNAPTPASAPTRVMVALNWGLLGVIALAALIQIENVISKQAQAEREYFPVAAVDFLAKQNFTGTILNQYNWGGYIIWRLYPRARVFIDGRSDLYGLTEDFIVTEYFKAYLGQADWREPLTRYGAQLVLMEPTAPIVTLLARDSEWQQIYTDEQAVIFRKE